MALPLWSLWAAQSTPLLQRQISKHRASQQCCTEGTQEARTFLNSVVCLGPQNFHEVSEPRPHGGYQENKQTNKTALNSIKAKPEILQSLITEPMYLGRCQGVFYSSSVSPPFCSSEFKNIFPCTGSSQMIWSDLFPITPAYSLLADFHLLLL